MSQDWTQEEIAALVDGSLEDEARAAQLRDILATDPEAQAYAGRLRALNHALMQAFETPVAEPIPAAIGAAIDGPTLPARVERQRAWRQSWIPVAMAASVALVIGLNFDRFFGPSEPGGITTVGLAAQESTLHLALETFASGTGTEDGIFPILTFRDGTGRPCREFETTNELADELLFGIACRTDAERWDVEIVVSAPRGETDARGYVPASGPAADILDTMLDTLGAGPTLAPEFEAELLENGWLTGL